jgi:hypothetical protein
MAFAESIGFDKRNDLVNWQDRFYLPAQRSPHRRRPEEEPFNIGAGP